MKNQTIKDERIVEQQRKINSEAYHILIMVLSASLFVKIFLLKAPFEEYTVELICLLGISIYIVVRYLMLGLNISGDGEQLKGTLLTTSVVAGTIVTVINGVSNYTKYAEHYKDNFGMFIATLVITFISATAITFALLFPLNYLNKKKQMIIQKQLDEDEQAK